MGGPPYGTYTPYGIQKAMIQSRYIYDDHMGYSLDMEVLFQWPYSPEPYPNSLLEGWGCLL